MKLLKAYSRLTLRTKITALAGVISTAALAIVATTGILQMRVQIAAEQHHSADSVALGIARASELPLTVGDTKEMSRLANSFLRNPEILFIAAYTDNPDPVVVTVRDHDAWNMYRGGAAGSPQWITGQSEVDAIAATDDFAADPADPTDVHRDPAPAKKGPIGRIVVGLSTAASRLAQARQSAVILTATCAAGLLGGLALFLTLGQWMRRLHRLDIATQSIASGDFTKSIGEARDDEIGRLAHSFEEMRQALLSRDVILRGFTETLQDQVKQRTHDLEAALASAREANHAKSLFLANMSHELRTPLNGVVGMVNLLQATATSAQQRRYCDVARVSAQSLLDLINDILDFSKIEAGKLELDSAEFDLHESIESVTQMLGERAERQNLELLCSIGADVPRAVIGDPVRLRQVVVNLVSNAIKFTEKGEVVVSIVTLEQTAAQAVVKVSIRDTGVGIPRDRLDRLFKSFSQVDASTTRKYGGTGLGLAISQRIVQMMNGEMGVESVEGKGSTFWFTARLRKRVVAASIPAVERADPRGIHVLAVDDNATNREILQAQLSSWSVRADLAANAEQAIEMLQGAARAGDPYRIAILDMHMPGTDGQSLARRIKTDPETSQVILISLSSMGDPAIATGRGPMDFAARLTKPVLPSSLYDAIVGSLASDAQIVATEPEGLIAASTQPLRGVRVLLAEDHEINRMVAAELLRRAGCRISIAVNGREAVELSGRDEFDVILMDCQMPELDGFAATKLIRQREVTLSPPRHMAIIALTANAIKGDRELCLRAGMDGYVTKPIEPAELFAAIGELVQGIRVAEPNETPPSGPTDRSALAAPEVAAAPPVDFESLNKRCLGNRELAMRVLESFVTSIGPSLDELSYKLRGPDMSDAAAAAHKLKGAAANLSAEQVRRLASDLETRIKDHSRDLAEASFNELKVELDRVREFVAGSLREVAFGIQPPTGAGERING